MNPTQLVPNPFFIGTTFNILLYAIMIPQTHLYFSTRKSDWFWMKIFIAFLFFANTLSSILTVVCAHQSLVNHFGDSSWWIQTNWVFATDLIIMGIIGGSVQLFFAWQVYILQREVFIVSAIVLCSSVGMFGALGTTIAAGIFPELVEFQKLKAIVIARLVIAACADLIIATTLMLHLGNRKDNFPVTSDVVIRMTMQTGLIATLFAVTNLVTFLSYDTGVHLVFNLPLASLHANSLLSRLNSPGGWDHNKSYEVNICDQGNPQRFRSNVPPEVLVHIEELTLVEKNSKLRDSFGKLDGQNGWSDQSKSGV